MVEGEEAQIVLLDEPNLLSLIMMTPLVLVEQRKLVSLFLKLF